MSWGREVKEAERRRSFHFHLFLIEFLYFNISQSRVMNKAFLALGFISEALEVVNVIFFGRVKTNILAQSKCMQMLYSMGLD